MLAKSTLDSATIEAARTRLDGAPPDLAVLAFEGIFSHRQRGKEAKDGALKEVRAHAERLAADPSAPPPDDVPVLIRNCFDELAERFT
jgi:hypothetical protein